MFRMAFLTFSQKSSRKKDPWYVTLDTPVIACYVTPLERFSDYKCVRLILTRLAYSLTNYLESGMLNYLLLWPHARALIYTNTNLHSLEMVPKAMWHSLSFFFFIKIIRNRKDEHVQYVYNIRIQYRIQLIQRNSIFVKISYNGFH